jgi:hypothetical protein
MSDLELLADTMEEWSTTSGDHHMRAAAAIRQLIKLQAALQHSGEPVVDADAKRTGIDAAQWRDAPQCSVCKEPQFETPSGVTCVNGHGGADPLEDAV